MNLKKIIILFGLFGLFAQCDSDFLDRPDLDTISEASFWKSPNDLKLYVNRFYNDFPGWSTNSWNGGIYWGDTGTDDIIKHGVSQLLAGNYTEDSGNNLWTFGNIRRMNIFMANYKNVEADFEDYKHYVGEALFFRAYFNFTLLQNFGEFPYTDKVLTENSEELHAPRTARNIIASNIINDLNDAISYMDSGRKSNGNRLSREIAMLFKARVALYEGTWERYHAGTPFGVEGSDGSSFLAIAENAAKDVMNSNVYSIHNTGNPEQDYFNVFNQESYANHAEVMLWQAYSTDMGLTHNGQRFLAFNGGGRGISKGLVDEYLCTDGKPIAKSSLYQGDADLPTVSTNRDLRLSQTIWIPGQPMEIDGINVLRTFKLPDIDKQGTDQCITGYQIRKGSTPDIKYHEVRMGTTSSPIFRYAEALLIYAEAKAELGTLTQTDVDNSINLLRARAGMPDLVIANISTDPNWLYPGLSPVINEIRREWHVEFAAEGYRMDNLKRWAAMKDVIVGKRTLGAIFKQSDFPNMVIGTDVKVDANGYIDPHVNEVPNGMQFNLERDYLLPIPQSQLVLNPKLTQNPGWSR